MRSVGCGEDHWATAFLMAATAVILAIGVSILDRTIATVMAAVGLMLAAATLVPGHSEHLRVISQRPLVILLTLGIAVELTLAAVNPPVEGPLFLLGLGCAVLLVVAAAMFTHLQVPALVVASVVNGALLASLVLSVPPPDIDVFMFQQEASAALLSGHNPYELRFPNIYGTQTSFYSSDVMDGHFLTFGFPYPPASLFMALPGYLLGDYRLAAAVSVAVTGLLVGSTRRGPVGPLAAGLLWFSPLAYMVVYNGWTEPFLGLVAAAAGVAAVRRSGMLLPAVALLIAVKQYALPFVLLAAVLVQPRENRWRFAWGSVAVAAMTVLPFLVMDPEAFVHSVGTAQLLQPFRTDSVSIPAFITRAGNPELPALAAFLALGISLPIVVWRSARTSAGTFAGATIVFLAFFLFSKQAFMNYYYFAVVLALLSSTLSAAPIVKARS